MNMKETNRMVVNVGVITDAARQRPDFTVRAMVANAGCALALLICPNFAVAAKVPLVAVIRPLGQTTSEPRAHVNTPPQVSWVDGALTVSAFDLTLGEILDKVAAATGVAIDVPSSARSQKMPVVQFGPGPARDILSALLRDSNLDYLIQESEDDPGKLESVMIIPRTLKGGAINAPQLANRPSFGAYPKPSSATSEAGTTQVADTTAGASSSSPQTPSSAPDEPMPDLQPRVIQQNLLPKSAALNPPQTMNQQSINSQLQQMYQQRMQMVQQSRVATAP
jgi:hypothetical protein